MFLTVSVVLRPLIGSVENVKINLAILKDMDGGRSKNAFNTFVYISRKALALGLLAEHIHCMATILPDPIDEKQNFETYCLIWLDKSVNESRENREAQTELRASINHLRTLDDDEQCRLYIASLSADDRVILIVSGHFGQTITPQIASYRQIVAVYVYCLNKDFHEKWASKPKKVCVGHCEEYLRKFFS